MAKLTFFRARRNITACSKPGKDIPQTDIEEQKRGDVLLKTEKYGAHFFLKIEKIIIEYKSGFELYQKTKKRPASRETGPEILGNADEKMLAAMPKPKAEPKPKAKPKSENPLRDPEAEMITIRDEIRAEIRRQVAIEFARPTTTETAKPAGTQAEMFS